MTILSIDQSTSATTAYLFSNDADPKLIYSQAHRQINPMAGWVEHDPMEILNNITAAIALGKSAGADVMGLANQGESCLAWDTHTKQPLTPIIVWQDTRTSHICRALAEQGHGALIQDRSGLRLSPYFSATKLGWCYQNVENAERLMAQNRLRLGTTDAFFRDVLTGRCETDVATASRTSLMNLDTCSWDAEVCKIFGVPMAALPMIGDCNGDLGTVDGLRLASSIVDQQAALYGHGCRTRGETKITFGTGAFALTLLGAEKPDSSSAAVPTVAWRTQGGAVQYALEGGVFTAASAVNWAKDLNIIRDFSEIATFTKPSMVERGLVFVPALSGLGCPHWHEDTKASWLGLHLGTSRQDMGQAVCEGVALRMAEILDEIEKTCALTSVIQIDGGLTNSTGFSQFLADVLQKPMRISDFTEQTSLGTALLAQDFVGGAIQYVSKTRELQPDHDHRIARASFAKARNLVTKWAEGQK